MPNILVVDDSPLDRQLAQGLLERVPDYFVVQAENGNEAIAKLKEWDVDCVITDMQMPEMDGLELVRTIRKLYPDLPAILITQYGSDEIAIKALDQGAAGYVPKSKLNELLAATVRDVLTILYTERSYTNLLSRMDETKISFVLDNDPTHFPPLLHFCDRLVKSVSSLDSIQRLRISVAIEHAMSNALYRGNLEIGSTHSIPTGDEQPTGIAAELIAERLQDPHYAERDIRVAVEIDRSGLTVTVVNQGPGFTPSRESVFGGENGRGLVLMDAFMDSVTFEDEGQKVIMKTNWGSTIKHGDPGQSPIEDSVELALEPIRKKPADTIDIGEKDQEKSLGRLVSSAGTISLTEDKMVIGRRDTCHIVLAFKEISKHHCQLIYKDGTWYVRDLKSRNGITINEKRVEKGKLKPGDVLGVANCEYTIQY